MIIDSSALIAIVKIETEAERMAQAIELASIVHISAATYVESMIVIDGKGNPELRARFKALVETAKLVVEPLTEQQSKIARQAYRDYGKGSGHRAGLNFGDCLSYALARDKREPLLYNGDDFIHTDIRSALESH